MLRKSIWIRTFLTVIVLAPTSASAAPTISGYGAMGASESAEEPGPTPDFHGSWVAWLPAMRGLNFGGPGDPYNVAIGGATTTTLLIQQQHTQMKALVQQNKVDLVSLSIGGNDYNGNAVGLISGQIDPIAFSNTVVTNIETAMDTVLSGGPTGMIVWSVPDMTRTAYGQASITTPELRQKAEDIINLANVPLKAEVLSRGLVFVDLAKAMQDITDNPLVVGGIVMDTAVASQDVNHFWQNNIHPGTIGNGLLANLAIEAFNIGYHQNIPLLTDQEILGVAGASALYTGETSNIDYAKYITSAAVPEASSLLLSAMAAIAILFLIRRRLRTIV